VVLSDPNLVVLSEPPTMSRIKCSICSYPETLVFQAKIAIWKFELKLIDFLVYHFYDVLIFLPHPKPEEQTSTTTAV